MWALLAIPAIYCLAALIGSLIPANPGWRPATGADAVTIFVESNGVHTGIVVPVVSADADFTDLVAPGFPGGMPTSHVQIGWGEANFYRGTPTWWDLKPGIAWNAVIGSSEVLLHVDYVDRPRPLSWRRAVTIDRATWRRLAAGLRAEFARPGDAGLPGYTPEDRFFPGHGRYSALTSCNNWTSARLAEAGITVGGWTPFQGGVMRWFPARATATVDAAAGRTATPR